MTSEQLELERQAFEAWYCFGNPNDKCFAKNEIGSYSNPMTVIAFNAWLARAEQSAWISVEDKLPELNKEVLTDYTSADYPPPNANVYRDSPTTTRKSRGAANPPPNARTARDTKP